jgi:hypothetical protein
MNNQEHRHLEIALAERCGRAVSVSQVERSTLRLVLEPIGDRGRVDLIASLDAHGWTVNDRGVNARLLDHEFEFILRKLEEIGTPVARKGDTIVAVANDVSFVESIAQFVSNLEFIPVLAGLWSNDRLTAVA